MNFRFDYELVDRPVSFIFNELMAEYQSALPVRDGDADLLYFSGVTFQPPTARVPPPAASSGSGLPRSGDTFTEQYGTMPDACAPLRDQFDQRTQLQRTPINVDELCDRLTQGGFPNGDLVEYLRSTLHDAGS